MTGRQKCRRSGWGSVHLDISAGSWLPGQSGWCALQQAGCRAENSLPCGPPIMMPHRGRTRAKSEPMCTLERSRTHTAAGPWQPPPSISPALAWFRLATNVTRCHQVAHPVRIGWRCATHQPVIGPPLVSAIPPQPCLGRGSPSYYQLLNAARIDTSHTLARLRRARLVLPGKPEQILEAGLALEGKIARGWPIALRKCSGLPTDHWCDKHNQERA